MEKYKNFYEIKFDTKKGGYKSYKYYIEAYTKVDAEKRFYENEIICNKMKKMHLFHVSIRRIKDDEILDHTILFLA